MGELVADDVVRDGPPGAVDHLLTVPPRTRCGALVHRFAPPHGRDERHPRVVQAVTAEDLVVEVVRHPGEVERSVDVGGAGRSVGLLARDVGARGIARLRVARVVLVVAHEPLADAGYRLELHERRAGAGVEHSPHHVARGRVRHLGHPRRPGRARCADERWVEHDELDRARWGAAAVVRGHRGGLRQLTRDGDDAPVGREAHGQPAGEHGDALERLRQPHRMPPVGGGGGRGDGELGVGSGAEQRRPAAHEPDGDLRSLGHVHDLGHRAGGGTRQRCRRGRPDERCDPGLRIDPAGEGAAGGGAQVGEHPAACVDQAARWRVPRPGGAPVPRSGSARARRRRWP